MVFSYLIGNGDLHAKNLSIRQGVDGRWTPTPVYDVLTTHPYRDTTMALTIDGRSHDDIGTDAFLALARAIDLPKRAAERALREVAAVVRQALPEFHALPFDDRRVHKLRKLVAGRLERVAGG